MKTTYSPFHSEIKLLLTKPLFTGGCKTLFLLLFLLFANQLFAQQRMKDTTITSKPISNYTYKIISSTGNTFGYDIYANGALRIHQPFIPAMQGNAGFATREAAEKVARLAISKMEKGEALPTISREEMKQLKAL